MNTKNRAILLILILSFSIVPTLANISLGVTNSVGSSHANSTSSGVTDTYSTLPAQPTVSSGGSSSGSSGGSTGGGVIVNEPVSNILNTDRKEKDLRAGSTATYQFNLDIYKIELYPTNNEDSVMIRVDELKSISSKTPTPPNAEVYKYFNVYSGTQRLNETTIYFKVPVSWLEKHGIAMIDKWNGKEWIQLSTTFVNSDDSYYYYQAITPTLSNFAIVAPPLVTEPAPPQSVTQPEPQQTTEPAPQEQPTQTPTVTIPGFGLLGALLIVYVIYRIKTGN